MFPGLSTLRLQMTGRPMLVDSLLDRGGRVPRRTIQAHPANFWLSGSILLPFLPFQPPTRSALGSRRPVDQQQKEISPHFPFVRQKMYTDAFRLSPCSDGRGVTPSSYCPCNTCVPACPRARCCRRFPASRYRGVRSTCGEPQGPPVSSHTVSR